MCPPPPSGVTRAYSAALTVSLIANSSLNLLLLCRHAAILAHLLRLRRGGRSSAADSPCPPAAPRLRHHLRQHGQDVVHLVVRVVRPDGEPQRGDRPPHRAPHP